MGKTSVAKCKALTGSAVKGLIQSRSPPTLSRLKESHYRVGIIMNVFIHTEQQKKYKNNSTTVIKPWYTKLTARQ